MSEFVTQFETEQGNKKYDFKSLGNFPTAAVGQFLKVTAVDENGNPTAWEMAEALKPDMSNLDEAADLSALASALGASKVVTGTYTGNGESSRKIDLGVTPTAVLVCTNNNIFSVGNYGGGGNTVLALTGQSFPAGSGNPTLTIVSGGFKVIYPSSEGPVYTNQKNMTYSYIAVI